MINALNKIYVLKNKLNNKIYIGQTWESLSKRFDNGKGYINCPYLWNAIQKLGADNFYYEILAECSTQEDADCLEQHFIATLNSTDRSVGYNLRSGGSRGKQSEETKEKISIANKGKIRSEQTKQKLSDILKSNPIIMIGEENPMFGKHGSEHPMFGMHHTDEARAKMRAAKLGKPSSKKGKPMSDEAKLKMSIARKGKPPWNKGKKLSAKPSTLGGASDSF